MEHKEILGHRLKILRVHYQLSQVQMAQKLNCDRAFISNWERGANLISTKHLIVIAQVFGISLDFFNPYNEDYLDCLKKGGKLGSN